MNRNFYQNARKRCMLMGTNIVTDADIILMQEEEIERYRDKIDYLEDKHREKVIRIACLEEENRKLREESAKEKDNDKTVRIGDVITVDCDGDRIKFKTMRCIVHADSWENGNVELCGSWILRETNLSE